MPDGWSAEVENLVARGCGDPGSVCSRKPGESLSRWSAHAVLTLLDANGLLVQPHTGPRVWAMPEIPDDVKLVRDRLGDLLIPMPGQNYLVEANEKGEPAGTSMPLMYALGHYGPLTEVLPNGD